MLPPNKEELVRKEEAKRVELVTKKMSKIKLTFKRHSTDGATLYGSVTARNIVQALAKCVGRPTHSPLAAPRTLLFLYASEGFARSAFPLPHRCLAA